MTYYKHIVLLLLSLTTCFYSCNQDETDDEEANALTAWSSGAESSIKMDFDWSASTEFSWITLPKASGKKGENLTFVIAPNTTGAKRSGYVTVNNTEKNINYRLSLNQLPILSGEVDGHEYVDVGMNVFWATKDVGASSPTEIGTRYKASEVQTAVASWGGKWRLPTAEEFRFLQKLCKETEGERYCAPNGEIIVFPWFIEISESSDYGYEDINPGGGINGGLGTCPIPIRPYWVSDQKNYSLFDFFANCEDLSQDMNKAWPLRLVMDRE